ncbi:GNAT family N-acetyltransferase [Proteiniclasticum sp. C24MP]|uniref:GNAT family N-acetyltransferase n=1 Tax=Proteiniclasticum sp. C24MP TaxID=3374101 RepID=UPI003753F9A4
MVLSEQFKAKDLQTFKNQLLDYKKFNELNENLYGMYGKSSLFNKIQYRSGTRIITHQDEPILIIWSETRSYNVKIRSIIPLIDSEKLEKIPLDDVMEVFRDSLPQHLEIHQFEYVVIRNEINDRILELLNFKMRRGIKRMHMNLSELMEPAHPVSMKKFQIEDIKARVDIQNRIFDNKYRLPINSADILIEISKKSYIPELSYFYQHQNHYIGYGQINKSENLYFLVNFGIIPEYRRRKLSKDFLLHLLQKAREYGIKEIYLDVNEQNEKAVGLYEKAGFKDKQSNCSWLYYFK